MNTSTVDSWSTAGCRHMRLTSITPTAASSLSPTFAYVRVWCVCVPVSWLKLSRLMSDVELTLQGNSRGSVPESQCSPHCSPDNEHQPYSFLFFAQAQPVTAVATHLGCPRDRMWGISGTMLSLTSPLQPQLCPALTSSFTVGHARGSYSLAVMGDKRLMTEPYS